LRRRAWAQRSSGEKARGERITLNVSQRFSFERGEAVPSIITSDYERYGNWSAFASCSGSDMMVGGNLRLEAKQGTGDDTSANYVQGICRRSDGTDYTINVSVCRGPC
jgi:hypothetical protein